MMFMTFLRARTVEGPGGAGTFAIYNSNGVGNMEKRYIIGIDQSTQGTKALLFDGGHLLRRTDLPHRQIVNEKGWVSHDLNEIYRNTVQTVKTLVAESGVAPEEIAGIGISSQRETTAIWDKATGEPLEEAIVWQCGRAGIAQEIAEQGHAEGDPRAAESAAFGLFSCCKDGMAASKRRRRKAKRAADGKLCLGTIDSWLVYKLTGDHAFKTDFSNASRTQLFNLKTLAWDEKICEIFGIPVCALAGCVIPMRCMEPRRWKDCFRAGSDLRCIRRLSCGSVRTGRLKPGMIKATYGTGSSLMMNIGDRPIQSSHGVVTSLAWGRGGKVDYVLEGNLNYTGAVITWLKDDLKLISSAKETEGLA